MTERQLAVVKILGEEYHIQGGRDPEEIARLAAYVDEALRRLMRASPVTDPKRLAVLASVNIAQQLFQERAAASALFDQVKEKADGLSEGLDGRSGGPRAKKV